MRGELTKLAERKNVGTSEVIGSFEALVIAVTEPPRNSRKERIPGATLVVQGGRDRPRPLRGILEDIRRDVKDLRERIEQIEGAT